jgi:hypothetical protein
MHGMSFPRSRFSNTNPLDNCTQWSFNSKKREVVKTAQAVLSDAVKATSELLMAKREAISFIIVHLNVARYPLQTGVALQETAYALKRAQAQRFKDSGYDEEIAIEVPFVIQYADFSGCTMREATDDILFKAKLSEEFLAKTELLRLTYFKKVREVRSKSELPSIIEDFMLDCYHPQLT